MDQEGAARTMTRLSRGWRASLLGLMMVGGTFGGARAVEAATAGKGFTVSPAFQAVDVRADQPKAQYELTLTSQAPADQNFRLSLVDFGSLDEEGGVAFLGQVANELDRPYGLASWMALEREAIFIPAGGVARIKVTIDNRASLAPGGHYGAVLATAVTDTGEPVVDPKVGVKQVLSSLVLATKEGGLERNLRLVSQTANHGTWRLPSMIEHRFQNTGNVHVAPRGVVEVRDPYGRIVQRGALNEQSGEILPQSFRRYNTPLIKIAAAWMPGYYQVKTTYRHDNTEATKTLVTGFWYAGAVVVWPVTIIALALVGALWWWLWRRSRR